MLWNIITKTFTIHKIQAIMLHGHIENDITEIPWARSLDMLLSYLECCELKSLVMLKLQRIGAVYASEGAFNGIPEVIWWPRNFAGMSKTWSLATFSTKLV